MILKDNCERLGPLLRGKLHVYMGTIDTFRLEGAVKRMKSDLEESQSDAEILLVEGRDHSTLFRPHPELGPDGMMSHFHQSMFRQWNELPDPIGNVP